MDAPLLLLFIAFQVADFLSTRSILALGGYERMWLTKRLMTWLGADIGLVVAKALVTIFGVLAFAFLGRFAVPVLAALDAAYALVLANNIRVIARLR